MNEPDFDDFAGLWRQEPAEEEVRIFRTLAHRTNRRAQMLQRAETLLGLVIAFGTLVAFLTAPNWVTGVIAISLATVVLWPAWKRHRLAAEEAQLNRRDRRALLESLERSARASLTRSTLGLIFTFPAWLLTIALGSFVTGDGRFDHIGERMILNILSWDGAISTAFICALMIVLCHRNFRLRKTVGRAKELRRAYREEDQLDLKPAQRRPD